MTNIALWIAGLALVGLAVWRVRAPFTRMGELDRLSENARRYDSWRGGRGAPGMDDETTGADVMRALMRRQVTLWTAVGLAGVILIVGGFAIR